MLAAMAKPARRKFMVKLRTNATNLPVRCINKATPPAGGKLFYEGSGLPCGEYSFPDGL